MLDAQGYEVYDDYDGEPWDATDDQRRAAYLDAQEVMLKALGWFRTRLACHKMLARQRQYPQAMIDEVLALEVRLAEMLEVYTPKA